MAPTDEERKATSPKQGLSPKALAARAAAAKKQAQAAARAKMEQLQEWKDRELEARSDLKGMLATALQGLKKLVRFKIYVDFLKMIYKPIALISAVYEIDSDDAETKAMKIFAFLTLLFGVPFLLIKFYESRFKARIFLPWHMSTLVVQPRTRHVLGEVTQAFREDVDMHVLILGSVYNICIASLSLWLSEKNAGDSAWALFVGVASFALAVYSLYQLVVRAQKVILYRASIHPVGKRLCFLCFKGAGDLAQPVLYKEESMVTWDPADYDVDRATNVGAQVAAKVEDAELRGTYVTDSYGAPRVAWQELGAYYEAKFGEVAEEEREHLMVETLPNGKRFVTLRGLLALGQLQGENAVRVAAAAKPKDERSTCQKLAGFCANELAGAIKSFLLGTLRYPAKLMIILFYVCVGLWNACVFAVCGFDARRQIREAIARSIDREDEEEGGADVARRDDREREMLATFGLLDEERLYHCGVFRQSYAYHLQLENILNVTIVTQLLLVNDAVLPNSAFFKFPLTLAQAHWNRLKARLVAKLAELRAKIDDYMVEYHRDELGIRYAGDVLAFQRTKSGLYGLMVDERGGSSGSAMFGAAPRRRAAARRGARVDPDVLQHCDRIEWTQGGEERRGSWAELKASILDRDVTAADTIRVEGVVAKWTKIADVDRVAELVPADRSPALYDEGRDAAPPSPPKKRSPRKKKASFSAPPLAREDFQGLDVFWTDREGNEHGPSTWAEYKTALCDGDVGFEGTVRAPPLLADWTKVKTVPALATLVPKPPKESDRV